MLSTITPLALILASLPLSSGAALPYPGPLAEHARGSADEIAELFPKRTLVYLEAPGLSGFLAQGLEQPALRSILDSELGALLLAGAEADPEALLAYGEQLLGAEPFGLLSAACDDGAALGLSFKAGGVAAALVLRASDEDAHDDVLDAASRLLEEQVGPGFYDGAQEVRDGVQLWELGDELVVGRRDEFLAVGNDRTYLHECLRRADGRGRDGLSEHAPFAAAASERGTSELLWAFVDRRRIEDLLTLAGAAGELAELTQIGRQPEVQFLLGPGIASIGSGETYTAALRLLGSELSLDLRARGASAFEGVSPAAGARYDGPMPGDDHDCLSAVLYRDFSAVYSQRAELFPAEVLPSISKAIGELTPLFMGLDLAEDVLPGLSPWVRVVVREVPYESGPTPEVSLPAAALIVQLEDADRMGPSLVGVFQTLISITNVERAQQGQPGLILGLAREGELEFTRAAYPAPREGDGVDLIYNLRPACGLLGDTLVISTHEDLMRELASELSAPGSRAGAPEGEHLRLAGAQLAQFVEANRELLIAQNQVDEGNSRPQAELEIGALHAGLALVRSAQLGVSWPGGGDVQLSISLSIQVADEEYGGSQ